MKRTNWSQEMKDKLRSMWLQGESSSEIAKELGCVTRNSVMGMVNRMGLMRNPEHLRRLKHPLSGCVVKPLPPAPEDAAVLESPSDKPPASLEKDAAAASIAEIVPEVPAPYSEEDGDASGDLLPRPELKQDESPAQMPEQASKPRAKAEPKAKTPASVQVSPRSTLRFKSSRKASSPPEIFASSEDEPLALSSGTIAQAFLAAPTFSSLNAGYAVKLVEKLTGQSFSWSKKGHSSSLVAIACILAGGHAKNFLMSDHPEPAILQVMRCLATSGLIVAGKAPETWNDPVDGDRIFFNDMLKAEGLSSEERRAIMGKEALPPSGEERFGLAPASLVLS